MQETNMNDIDNVRTDIDRYKNIKISRLNPEDWLSLKAQLISLEKRCFHPDIQETERSKRKLLTLEDTIAFVAEKNGKVLGESYGLPIQKYKGIPDSDRITKDYASRGIKAFYHVSLAVLPEYREHGIGSALIGALFAEAKRQGYDVILAHAKEGASLELHNRRGAKVIKSFDNWFGTGNKYWLCEVYIH